MHWLNYVFFGLMIAMGAVVCALFVRARMTRAWIWAGVALVGAAGLVAAVAAPGAHRWRSLTMCATFALFAVDNFVQHAQSKSAGSPKKLHLGLGVLWLLLGALQLVDFD
jgi:hypothetical protein